MVWGLCYYWRMEYAFVTGANRGIGRGFIDYLYDEGYFVIGGTRKISETDKDRLKWVELDVSSDESIERAVDEVSKLTDSIDLLVNNAGLNSGSATDGYKDLVCDLSKLSREHLLLMFDVNSIGPMMVVQKFLPLLTRDSSFVMNVSSCRASYNDEFNNTTGNYGYRASKIALNMMTFCSTWDLPENVKTFVVHPGGVKTDMNPKGEDLPYEQAEKMVAIINNWKEEFNGKFLRYDGNFYPL